MDHGYEAGGSSYHFLYRLVSLHACTIGLGLKRYLGLLGIIMVLKNSHF